MNNDARLAIARLNLSDCLVTPQSTHVFLESLRSYSATTREQGAEAQVAAIASVEQMYGYGPKSESDRKPFIYNDGVAVIPVHGVLLNRFSGCWGFVTGYNFIRAQMNAAEADPDVTLIVFDVNSPGGDAAGCFELTEEIRALETPTMAVVDDLAASGGYAVPAACDRMVATQSSTIGSIGVYRLHVDVSGANAQAGVVYTFIFAGEHKVDGNPFEALPDSVRADMQASVEQTRDMFIADVALSRGLDEDAVRETEARVYRANEALALGLIDAVSTPQNAVSAFVAELADDEPTADEDENMALPKTEAEMTAALEAARAEGVSSAPKVDAAQVAKDAVAADRTRRAAITSLDEAKDRPKLALTLADTEGMTAETAKIILSAAAVEKAEAPANPLIEKMNQNGGAKVLPDADAAPGGEDANKPKIADNIASFIPRDRRVAAAK